MDWKVRRPRARFFAFSIVGVLVAARTTAAAQTATPTLTVQPREMATGTQNPAAGIYPLDPDSSVIVTVPPQCAGAHRCPMLVALPGGGQPGQVMTGWVGPVANKYGFILLAPNEDVTYDASKMDAVLKEVLQKYAIDPAKIAVSGRCASGSTGMSYGIDNLHVFSRIAVISGGLPVEGMDPQNKTAEFLIDAGYEESGGTFAAARALQDGGHPVRHTVTLRGHEHQAEDYDFLGRWLAESWAKPDPKSRTAPTVIDPMPLLTTEVVTKMTTFWTSFFKEPDSIRLAGRRGSIRDVAATIGEERAIIPMTDMTAVAAKYPSVAAALKNAGLTGQQHDAYRLALVTAMTASAVQDGVGTIDPNSVLGKNVAFIAEHTDALQTLENTGIADGGSLGGIGGCCTDPQEIDQIGPLGIWRTP